MSFSRSHGEKSMAIRRKGVGLGTILLGMEIKSQFLSQQSSRVLCSGAAHLCLSAICARTWASTLVGSCIASEPNTRIRLLIRTGGREGRGGEGRGGEGRGGEGEGRGGEGRVGVTSYHWNCSSFSAHLSAPVSPRGRTGSSPASPSRPLSSAASVASSAPA